MNVESNTVWKRLRSLVRNLTQAISKSEFFLSGILCDYRGTIEKEIKLKEAKKNLHKLRIYVNEVEDSPEKRRCLRVTIPECFTIAKKEIKEVYWLDRDMLTASELAKIILTIEVLENQIKVYNEDLMFKNPEISEYRGIAEEVSWRLNEVKLGILEYIE